jgi:hypothetical protein
MKKKAREIYDKYIAEGVVTPVVLKPVTKHTIEEVLEWGGSTCFDDAKGEIYLIMKKEVLPR